MDNVTARINQVGLLLPNPALMSSSDAAISRAMTILRPVIVDERVVQFVNSIRQQDMRAALLKIFWATNDIGADHPGVRGVADNALTNRTYLTTISFLLSVPGISHPEMMKMFDEVERVFNAEEEERIRAEAADIMHRFYPARGERMLDELRALNIGHQRIPQDNEEVITMNRRQQPAVIPEQQQFQNNHGQNNQRRNLRVILADRLWLHNKKVIYDDSQNVHNTTINESVISSARALIEEMVATVTFDGRYKFNVFRDDTVKSITHQLADVLKRFPEDITILGDADKQELQPRMTYKIAEDAKSKEYVSRFKPEEVDLYMEVIGLEDYIFPKNVVREGELGRRLEELFIVTNQYLTNVFNDEELLFYLDLTGIPGAEIIWFEREEILKDMYAVIGNERQRDDINDFLEEVFDDIETACVILDPSSPI